VVSGGSVGGGTGLGVVRGRYGTVQGVVRVVLGTTPGDSAVVLLCRWVVSTRRAAKQVPTRGWHRVAQGGTGWHTSWHT